ncbi:MAG: DUF561 domain-containing protein [Oscillospiraceae bacterium]
MSARQKLTDCKFRDLGIDKKPALIAADIIQPQRAKTACALCGTDPAGEPDFLLYIFKTRVFLGDLNGFRDKLRTLQKLRHDRLVSERFRKQLASHEYRAGILAVLFVVIAPDNDLAFRLNKGIVNLPCCYQALHPREIIRCITTGADIVFIQHSLHEKAHRFFLDVTADESVIRMLFPDDPRDGTGGQSTDTGNQNCLH